MENLLEKCLEIPFSQHYVLSWIAIYSLKMNFNEVFLLRQNMQKCARPELVDRDYDRIRMPGAAAQPVAVFAVFGCGEDASSQSCLRMRTGKI
jgi:hypothetical protein